MAYTLPTLSYNYDALEPYIDAQTMEIHHSKHHATYVDKLNQALEKHPDLAEKEIEELLKSLSSLPDDIKTAVQNNGGGHANHSLFWATLSPKSELSEGELKKTIAEAFTDVDTFKAKMKEKGLARFGSGWVWLVNDKGLSIIDTPNQDSPLIEGITPLFGIDLWEHAYYLKYQNKRADYIDAIWNVVNWKEVENRLIGAK